MTETKVPYRIELKELPFYTLFEKRPYLVPVAAMLNRQLGVLREFYEIQIKPFTIKK